MSNLVKIREVALRYDVSARTLRYYEDMGLLQSVRSPDYAYRLYDEAAIKRLEQILILRRLNISIRDIRRICAAAGPEVLLDVLGKKADSIDEEVSLLRELKKIVLDFIGQIKQLDFEKESDVKLLYEKAKDVETQLVKTGAGGYSGSYRGSSGGRAATAHFLEVTEKLDRKVPDIMIVRVPAFRAVTSGPMPYEALFGSFEPWQEAHDHLFTPILFDAPDFLCDGDGGTEWLWRVKDGVTDADTAPYRIVQHPGGLYAAAVSVDGDGESGNKVLQKIERWLEGTGFVMDPGRATSVHMIYVDEEIQKGLGYHQLNFYAPIKLKGED